MFIFLLLARFQHNATKCHTSHSNLQCFVTYRVNTSCCVRMTRLYLASRQMTGVCVYDQYRSVRLLAKYTCRGNAIAVTRKTYPSRTVRLPTPPPQKKSRESKTIMIHLVPRKIHNYCCKIHRSWGSRFGCQTPAG